MTRETPAPARSDALRSPAGVAASIREVARRLRKQPGDDLVLSPEGVAGLVLMLEGWATVLEGGGPVPAPRSSDAWPLSESLLQMGDLLRAGATCSDGLYATWSEVETLVAELQRLAHRAARLQLAIAGMRFVAAEDLPPPLPDRDEVVPGLETGTGDHVTFGRLVNLAAERARRVCANDLRPCDVEGC